MTVNPLKTGEEILELPVARLVRSYFQPRELFENEKMRTTLESIKAKGQLVPVVVRVIMPGNQLFDPVWEGELYYEIADGERRYRCCKELGLKTIKGVVRDLRDEQMLDYTLTTNDSVPLNPIERSRVFFRMADEFGKNQAQIAKSYNLKQQQVSEYIRLLDLPEEVQELTARAVISLRHARELLKISAQDTRLDLGLRAAKEKMSTRELSELVRQHTGRRKRADKKDKIKHSDMDFDLTPLSQNAKSDQGDLILNTGHSGERAGKGEPSNKLQEGASDEERALASAPIRKEPLFSNLFDHFLAFFGQLNALFLFGKFRRSLLRHMKQNPALDKVAPENYLAMIELSVLLPTALFFGLFYYQAVLAIGLASFLGAIFLYRFWEKRQIRR